jgi:hypothetical protein
VIKQLPHLQLGGVGYKTTQFAPHLRNLHKHKFVVLKAKPKKIKNLKYDLQWQRSIFAFETKVKKEAED